MSLGLFPQAKEKQSAKKAQEAKWTRAHYDLYTHTRPSWTLQSPPPPPTHTHTVPVTYVLMTEDGLQHTLTMATH